MDPVPNGPQSVYRQLRIVPIFHRPLAQMMPTISLDAPTHVYRLFATLIMTVGVVIIDLVLASSRLIRLAEYISFSLSFNLIGIGVSQQPCFSSKAGEGGRVIEKFLISN
jgi:hypothetical protein